MEILIITGPPYSGKGTQCEKLVALLNYKHVSTGDRCRLEKVNNTSIGQILSAYEEKGDLVPDAVMKELFNTILDENFSYEGIILDGYPRSIVQVDDLLSLINMKGLKIKKVINIDVPHEELLIRANIRALSSNRVDDKDINIHIKRIELYESSTKPAIAYMKSKLEVITISGMGEIQDVTARVIGSL